MSCASGGVGLELSSAREQTPRIPESGGMPVPALDSIAAGLLVPITLDVRVGKELLAQNLKSQLSSARVAAFYFQSKT